MNHIINALSFINEKSMEWIIDPSTVPFAEDNDLCTETLLALKEPGSLLFFYKCIELQSISSPLVQTEQSHFAFLFDRIGKDILQIHYD